MRGKGGAVRHQRGGHFRRPQGGCMVFAAKGGIRNGARRRRTSPAQRYYLPPEGESPQPACKASADHRQNPGSPGPKGPAAGSTLTPVRACQPSGILGSAAMTRIASDVFLSSLTGPFRCCMAPIKNRLSADFFICLYWRRSLFLRLLRPGLPGFYGLFWQACCLRGSSRCFGRCLV